MSAEDLEMVRSRATIIFHLAAIYDLAVTREVAMQVNFEGTCRVNELARSVSRLKQYHYISTCYVAGKRKGLIRETELQHNAGFRNYYEETKYLAENEVERLKSELPVTIHRPSVVCGDSRTGETVKYDGVYYLIHYLLRWPNVLSHFNIGNDAVALNLVPVDFVVNSLAVLANDTNAIGKTLQLADPEPLTTRELFDCIAETLTGHGASVTMPAKLVNFTLMLPPSPAITGLPHHGVPYFFLKQSYDTTQAGELLRTHNLLCPPFGTYVEKIVGFAASKGDTATR
jgi:thioester reductase-like protein